MVCPNCGYTNQPGNRFCVRCGIDTAAHRPPAPDAASPTPLSNEGSAEPQAVAPVSAAPPPPPAPPAPWGVPAPPTGPPPGYAPGSMTPPPTGPPPGYAPGAAPPGPPNPFAPPTPTAPPGYPQWGYGQYPPPYPPSGGWAPQSMNGLAVASLILGLVGWVACGVGSVLAVIFGFVSQTQIRESHGRQSGAGMAKAGIILGFIGVGMIALIVVASALSGSGSS